MPTPANAQSTMKPNQKECRNTHQMHDGKFRASNLDTGNKPGYLVGGSFRLWLVKPYSKADLSHLLRVFYFLTFYGLRLRYSSMKMDPSMNGPTRIKGQPVDASMDIIVFTSPVGNPQATLHHGRNNWNGEDFSLLLNQCFLFPDCSIVPAGRSTLHGIVLAVIPEVMFLVSNVFYGNAGGTATFFV